MIHNLWNTYPEKFLVCRLFFLVSKVEAKTFSRLRLWSKFVKLLHKALIPTTSENVGHNLIQVVFIQVWLSSSSCNMNGSVVSVSIESS